MSLYVSQRQFRRSGKKEVHFPLILSSPGLVLNQRQFPPEFEYRHLLLDVYEVSNPTEQEIPYLLLPTASVTLLFPVRNLGNHAWLAGPQTLLKKIVLPPSSFLFAVRLQPASGEWIAKGALPELADSITLLNRHQLYDADYLLHQMRRAESYHERMLMLFRLLASRQASGYRPAPIPERCIQIANEKKGLIQVQDLAGQCGCSERYLNMLFTRHVGLSTKLYCQITQIHHSLNQILTEQPKSLLQTAIDFGYCDQTHMNRFYRKYLNGTAGDMRYPETRNRCARELIL